MAEVDELVQPGSPSAALGAPTVIDLDVDFDALSVEVGDFDGDANLDLLVMGIGSDGAVADAILLGDGDGAFSAPFDPGLVTCSAYPVVGRLTNDDRDDVVVAVCPGGLDIFESGPTGLASQWDAWPEDVSYPVVSTLIADVEGDGDQDLVRLRPAADEQVQVFQSRDGRDFWTVSGSTVAEPAFTSFEPQRIALANLDGQPPLDLLLTDIDYDVARMIGTPTIEYVQPLELGVDLRPWNTYAQDLDGDGLDDVIVTSRTDRALQVHLSTGAGLSSLPVHPLGGFTPWDAAFGDFDGDGTLDLAATSEDSRRLRIEYGDGSGGLENPTTIGLAVPAVRIHSRDFDNDGAPDLLAGTLSNGTVTLLRSSTAAFQRS